MEADFSQFVPTEEDLAAFLSGPREVMAAIEESAGRLFHHKRSFMGCFSIHPVKNVDWPRLRLWKDVVDEETTCLVGDAIIPYVSQYYDFITTAPPNGTRNLDRYCCFELGRYISAKTGLPFVISFKQRAGKRYHGRFESMKADPPELVEDWPYWGKSILWIDDFITSGTTAKGCFEAMRKQSNHVDGLIYCHF